MPSSKQRSEVWRGIRKKTSGGLTKGDLIKNKRGKLVSRKKSGQASSQNNLGSWLREKGKKVAKEEMLRKGKNPPPKSKPKKSAAHPSPKLSPRLNTRLSPPQRTLCRPLLNPRRGNSAAQLCEL